MAYPTDLLDVDVEIQVGSGGTWVNITQHVSRANGDRIVIERGRQDPRSQVTPSSCRLVLLDPDGRYSPRNPTGPYYGILSRNTPIRVIVNAGAGPVTRFVGEIGALPQSWTTGGALIRVAIQAAGIMRRLGQGAAPLPSAATRGELDDVALGGAGYLWPLEEGADATEGRSLLGEAEAMRPWGSAAPLFGRVDGPPGSGRLPDFSSQGALVATVPATVPDTGTWSFEWWFRSADGDSAAFTATIPLQVDFVGGTIPAWDIAVYVGAASGGGGSPGTIAINCAAYTASPPALANRSTALRVVATGVSHLQGSWEHLEVTWVQTAPGSVRLEVGLNGASLGSTTQTTWTLGRPSRVVVNPCQDTPNTNAYAGVDGIGVSSIGHILIKNYAAFGIVRPAGLGWHGEASVARAQRLADEQAVPLTVAVGASQYMGPQGIDTLLGHLRQCSAVDAGFLYEARDSLGLAYKPGGGLYNQAPALTLDYATAGHIAPPLVVTDDDQGIRNRVTVQRAGGGQRTASRDTGPLSTQDPPAGVGVYDETLTLNCATDDQAGYLAGWRVHLGTWDEPRIQSLCLYLHTLAAAPSGAALLAAAVALDLGDVVALTSLPTWVARDARVMVQRYVEAIGETDWTLTAVTSPAGPWDVGVLDSGTYGRLDTAGSELDVGVSASATTWQVRTTAGPVWTSSTPLSWMVGGERVTATAVGAPSGGVQTCTVTRAANGISKSHAAGTPIRLVYALTLAQ